VYFSIDTRGSLANLAQAITLGDLLKPIGQSAPESMTTTVPAAGSITAPAVVAMPTLHFQFSH
ncbi:MAG: hypothetical protein ACRESC_00760, partial [Gammaproteobacteria bacterium]